MIILQLCLFLALMFCVHGRSSCLSSSEETAKFSCAEIPFYDTITKAEYLVRNLISRRKRGVVIRLQHDAIRVHTTRNGIWLLEKGKCYASQVYTDPEMYEYEDTIAAKWQQRNQHNWKILYGREVDCHNYVTMHDIIEEGYPYQPYHLIKSNCQHAAKAMWKAVTEKCRAPRMETPSWIYDGSIQWTRMCIRHLKLFMQQMERTRASCKKINDYSLN